MNAPGPPAPPSEIRRPSDRLALVRWVRDTPGLQEPDWLEWKSGYDLTKNPDRAAAAKHLIGFANRDPDAAARHLAGVGGLLIGVEPGACPGVPEYDSADLENWLRPFVGEKVVYDIHYLFLDGSRVLLLAVDAPHFGDDIHCLRRTSQDADTGKNMREGTIFVRKTGKTEPADAADIDRLTDRARRAGASLTLDLEVAAPVKALDQALLSAELRDEYLKERRATLLGGLPSPATGLTSIARINPNEFRSQERFIAEVDRFVDEAKRRWQTFAAVQELKDSPSKLSLVLVNESSENFSDVVLEVTVPLPRSKVHLSASDAEEWLQPPTEPPEWGRGGLRMPNLKVAAGAPLGAELVDLDGESTLVRCMPIQVRPHTRHEMPEVLLVLAPSLVGQTLEAPWRATSSSTRGQVTGVIGIEVVPPDDLETRLA